MTPPPERHRRHLDFEPYDRIELVVVPRFKTSGISGDEWRTSVEAKFFFKGEEVQSFRFRDMQSALLLLPHRFLQGTEPIPERILELEKTKCSQPGCHRDAVSKFKLKRLTSARGEYLDAEESSHASYFRRFCKRHLCRGDAGREDADDNYEVLEGPGPDASSNLEESPAAFGGVIEVDE